MSTKIDRPNCERLFSLNSYKLGFRYARGTLGVHSGTFKPSLTYTHDTASPMYVPRNLMMESLDSV